MKSNCKKYYDICKLKNLEIKCEYVLKKGSDVK